MIWSKKTKSRRCTSDSQNFHAFFLLCRSGATGLSPSQWAARYRCMQLLQTRANEILRYPFAGLKTLFLLGTVRCLYGVLRMNGIIRVFNGNSAICYVVFLVIFFKALGDVYDLSEKTVGQQKRNMGNKWFRRFHRTCWPLKYEIAGMYFVDPPMSLTMASFVLENVVNMLILGAWMTCCYLAAKIKLRVKPI